MDRHGGLPMGVGEIPLEGAGAAAGTRTPDLVLVDLCRKGAPQAFARLVALHEGMVFNLAARLLGESEEARDVAQNVFLHVYRKLDQFQGRSALRTWIYRITVNQCHNRRRWWKSRKREKEEPLDELSAGSHAARLADERPRSSPFKETRRRERARRVQAALLELSFEHRAVLVLREIEGLSCEAIAETLGVAVGTVKSRLSRAREALRRQLADWIGEDGVE
jgi:RNA polymerase sigma-70 factor (ECF subfamily)